MSDEEKEEIYRILAGLMLLAEKRGVVVYIGKLVEFSDERYGVCLQFKKEK